MNKKTWIAIAVVIVLFIIGIAFIGSQDNTGKTVEDIAWPSGVITPVEAMEYDWGNINIKGGDVEHVYLLKNSSDEPLVVKSAVTSCMCTTAIIEIDGEKPSPEFGMHSKPSSWSAIVEAGETFKVRAIYDPMAHGPDAVGEIARTISVITSAAPDGDITLNHKSTEEGSVFELKAYGNVMYEDDYDLFKKSTENSESSTVSYENIMGDFAFAETEYDFGVVKQSQGIVSYDFPFMYNGTESVTVSALPSSCACTSATIDKSDLEPGDTGVITLSFDPNLHEEPEGKFFKTISVKTEPESNEMPELKMWAEMDLDLGPEAYKLQEPHED